MYSVQGLGLRISPTTGEFTKRFWEVLSQLFVTLLTISIYPSANKQLRRHLPNSFRELPCISAIRLILNYEFTLVSKLNMNLKSKLAKKFVWLFYHLNFVHILLFFVFSIWNLVNKVSIIFIYCAILRKWVRTTYRGTRSNRQFRW